jgi:hypothetical protein
MSTQEKKMSLVSCIVGLAIGVALVGFMPTLLSDWDCNMIVSPDGYIWFVAVNNNSEDTFDVDNVINVLWEYQLEKGN